MFLSNRGSFRPETSGAYTLRRRGRRRPKSGSAIGACAVARLAGSGGPIGDYYGSANNVLEAAVGKRAFQRMFGLILTDNGAEFSDWESLERSCLPGKGARCRVYYCDVRQSQQKGGCERNHVELRKLLPKRRGISFDDLEAADMAAVMSQLNSEPRPSMAFMPPLRALLAAYGDDGAALTAALGVEEVPYGELLLGVEAVNRARLERGADPLI